MNANYRSFGAKSMRTRRRSSSGFSESSTSNLDEAPMSANDVAEANKRIDDYGDMSIKHRELVIEAKKGSRLLVKT